LNTCTKLQSTIEYIRKDKFALDILKFPAFLQALLSQADVVIFNFGVHYTNEKLYRQHLDIAFSSCGEINNNRNLKSCFFRENFPQHFQPKNGTAFKENFVFHWDDIKRGKCGPFQEGIHPQIFWSKAELQRKYPNVPIIPTLEALRSAWNWHPKGPDCTHFCQDSVLWDIVHLGLIKTWYSWMHLGTKGINRNPSL